MINIHLYPTKMTHESRIFKISDSINSQKIFDKIILLGINSNNDLPKSEKISENIYIERMNISSEIWISGKSYEKINALIKFWILSFYNLFKKKPSVINVHNLASLPPATLCKLFFKTKIVYDTHELETERQGWNSLYLVISKFIEKTLIYFCDEIVVVTQPIASYYQEKYSINPVVIQNVPKYVEVEKSDYLRKKFQINANKKIYLFVGNITLKRGVKGYLDFFSKTNLPVNLVFLGDGLDMEVVKDYVNKFENIFYHPSVSYDKIFDIISSADFTLLSLSVENESLSYRYSLPNKLFESIMAGTPVIGGGLLYQSTFVEENKIGCNIFNNTFSSIEKAINSSLDLDKIKLSERCKELSKVYNWENEEEKIKRYLYKLVN